MSRALALLAFACVLFAAAHETALASAGRALRVGVIADSPPMSYVDADGQYTGLNIEFARALCATMRTPCEFVRIPLRDAVDVVSRDEIDFAAVSLLITPERGRKVLFTKPYYRSLSAWVARPSLKPGAPVTVAVAVVKGSVQASYARAQGWKVHELPVHSDVPEAVLAGRADAVLLPMLTALGFLKHPGVAGLGWEYRLMSEPELAGDVGFAVSPRRAELRDRINAAIDQVKSDGRFDRISSRFLPFKLQ